jgi:hypothetical protein
MFENKAYSKDFNESSLTLEEFRKVEEDNEGVELHEMYKCEEDNAQLILDKEKSPFLKVSL